MATNMAFKKVTPTQIKFLKELHEDTKFGSRNASMDHRTAVALAKNELVEWKAGRWFGGRWWITQAGVDVLNRDTLIAERANEIMLREQDRCAFEHFVKMAIKELITEGKISC